MKALFHKQDKETASQGKKHTVLLIIIAKPANSLCQVSLPSNA